MIDYIKGKEIELIIKNGILIGETKPSKETKETYFLLYAKDSKIFAICTDGDIHYIAEEISKEKLSDYLDEPELSNSLSLL